RRVLAALQPWPSLVIHEYRIRAAFAADRTEPAPASGHRHLLDHRTAGRGPPVAAGETARSHPPRARMRERERQRKPSRRAVLPVQHVVEATEIEQVAGLVAAE